MRPEPLGQQPTQAVGSGPGCPVDGRGHPPAVLKEGLRGKLKHSLCTGVFSSVCHSDLAYWKHTDISNGRKTVVSERSVAVFLLPDALFSVGWCRK